MQFMVVFDNSLPISKVTYATDATTDECGDAATSYYKEFIYNGKRVIVSNNVNFVSSVGSSLCYNAPHVDPRQ